MPVIQEPSQEPPDKNVFVENANVQHPRRHQEVFLRSRPYRGELPTVAGFLLYPDTPAKMETTSREAFCSRPIPQQDRDKGDHSPQNTLQQSNSSHHTDQTGRGISSSGHKVLEEDEQGGKNSQLRGSTALKNEGPADMLTLYQKDFPPPSSCRRRRTPALPQPDNIGINPSFRIEFSTVQKETYPEWSIMNPSLRVNSPRQPPKTSEHKRLMSRK